MAKLIKFDLPINGTKVKNLEELRENLTDEIVGLARSGQLTRWLTTRHLAAEAERVKAAVANESDDAALCLALCGIFDVDVFPEDVAAIFGSPGTAGTKLGDGKSQMKLQAAQKILRVIMKCGCKELFSNWKAKLGDIEEQLSLLEVESYRDLGDGTVLDTTTGLQWMRCAFGQRWDGHECIGDPIEKTNSDLANKVTMFNRNGGFAGHTDWRAPSNSRTKIQHSKTVTYRSQSSAPPNRYTSCYNK